MHKPNMLLESDVQEGTIWGSTNRRTHITIKADSGNVTLSGSCRAITKRHAADDVTVVRGVPIDNQLVGLLGETMNDADMRSSAAALDADKFVPKVRSRPTYSRVRHAHRDGAASLRAAGRDARRRGSTGYWASTTASRSQRSDPSDVADRIKKAFKRNAIIDDSMIEVSNDGHAIEPTAL